MLHGNLCEGVGATRVGGYLARWGEGPSLEGEVLSMHLGSLGTGVRGYKGYPGVWGRTC